MWSWQSVTTNNGTGQKARPGTWLWWLLELQHPSFENKVALIKNVYDNMRIRYINLAISMASSTTSHDYSGFLGLSVDSLNPVPTWLYNQPNNPFLAQGYYSHRYFLTVQALPFSFRLLLCAVHVWDRRQAGDVTGPDLQTTLAVGRPSNWFYGLTLSEQREERELNGNLHMCVQAMLPRTENREVCNSKPWCRLENSVRDHGEPCMT